MDSTHKLLEPGDLVEFKNFYDFYAHWGVYAGDGYVIHVIGDLGNNANSSVPNSVAEGLAAFVGEVDTYVRKEKLQKVASGRTFYKNNQLDHTHTPLPKAQIVRKSTGFVGQKWDYRLLSSNCEHFASQMRYGVPISLQTVAAQQFVEDVQERVYNYALNTVSTFAEIVFRDEDESE